MNATYHKGSAYPNLEVSWEQNDEPVDLTGATITMKVFAFGGPVLFTKTTGFTAAAPVAGEVPLPNLTVQWSSASNQELNLLGAGIYVMQFIAVKSGLTSEMYAELVIRENAPNFGYCEIPDLLLGDLKISSKINLYSYINAAADEINVELGQIYEMPLVFADSPEWVLALIRRINAYLATGMVIMALAAGDEDTGLHAYGQSLAANARGELARIRSNDVVLAGQVRSSDASGNTALSIVQRDSESPVDIFEDFVMRGRNVYWQPGSDS